METGSKFQVYDIHLLAFWAPTLADFGIFITDQLSKQVERHIFTH